MNSDEKISWKRLGNNFALSELNNLKWNDIFTQYVKGLDSSYPIVRLDEPQITRMEIFETLWKQISISLGNNISIQTDHLYKSEMSQIELGYKIYYLTNIFAHFLSEKSLVKIGSKRDPYLTELKSILKYVEKIDKIKELKPAKQIKIIYPEFDNSIIDVQKSQATIKKQVEALIVNVMKYKDVEGTMITLAALGVKNLGEKAITKLSKKHLDALEKVLMFKYNDDYLNNKNGFTENEIENVIRLGLEDLKLAGFISYNVKNRMHNLMLQKIEDDYIFKVGKIKRARK